VSGQHIYRTRQILQRAHVPFMMWHVADPVLDRADRRHFLAELQQCLLRITLTRCQRILKHDQREIACIGDAFEVRKRHRR
jgi:hypothetical protein